ncbi:hypothetical protein [uncultured Sneathiella sp.]|uniref:hypothetical protein n=1 Tax=uncultured Sneathiella sp. TaxID=879315 RepID=UPI0030DDA559|tara:strand:+ start:1148 stop:1570 length:423 start_codon:yes stop_codon:yes gene_type:complete
MKSLQNLIRVHKWKLDEKRRELADFEEMREGFLARLHKLDEELQQEIEVADKDPELGFAFASYAAAAKIQRENIYISIKDVEEKIAALNEEVAECFQELKKYEIALEARMTREKYSRDRAEQTAIDDMAIELHRRKSAPL